MNKKALVLIAFVIGSVNIMAQRVGSSPEYIKSLTVEWKGERSPDGRPMVSDDMLERLKAISIEEAWGVLRNKGFRNQFEGDWHIINPEEAYTEFSITHDNFNENVENILSYLESHGYTQYTQLTP